MLAAVERIPEDDLGEDVSFDVTKTDFIPALVLHEYTLPVR